jgi:phytol kinase
MVKLFLVAAIVLILLLAAEYLWRVKKLRSELTRKFVHITVGSFAAFWPWIISRSQIEIMALAFLVVIIVSRLFTIFSSIHLIGRKTIGEIFFALSIGSVALITANRYIFMAALLQLSIADGMAAIIGTKYGNRHRYAIFGQRKSLVGSLTFLVCSIAILAIYFSVSHATDVWPTLIWLPLVATLLENIGVQGSDNVLVPLTVAIVLRWL